MAKRKNAQALNVQPLAPLKPVEQKDFYNMPDSPASDLILKVLGAGKDIADLPEREKQVSHGTKIEVLERGNQRQIILKSQKASVTIELADIDKLTGSNKPAKKLFVLALIKANEQAIHNGQLSRDYVSFPLQELVDIGFYKALRSARTGFNSGADILTSLKIKGHIKQTKKKGSSIDALEVLFTGAKIENNQCFLRLNYAIDWSFIALYFTILPRYCFKLSNRAFDLLYYIFYLARQHTKQQDIQTIKNENTGKEEQAIVFNISFRAIQQRLQLPNEVGSPNPQRDIKNVIEAAIEEIETEHKNYYNNLEFSLFPVCDDTAPIAEYLDNGYLQITLKGTFAETFIAISEDTAKQIKAAQKRQDRITEKAVAINTAKKLEAEEQAKKDKPDDTE